MLFDMLKRPLSKLLLAIALIFSFLFIKDVFLEFLISLFHYLKVNVPSVAYLVLRSIGIVLPLVLLSPVKNGKKVKTMKYLFIAMGVCYILGCTWIFYFLADNPVSALSNINRLTTYQYDNALVLNYLIWGTYDAWGILFGIIEGALFILLGINMTGHRLPIAVLLVTTFLLLLVFPFLYVILTQTPLNPLWVEKNLTIIASYFCVVLSLLISSSSHFLWGEAMWE